MYQDSFLGIQTVSVGGKKVKLNRLERIALPAEEPCPFCEVYRSKNFSHSYRDWCAFDNLGSIRSFRKLLLPSSCWPEELARELGGPKEIAKAVLFAARLSGHCFELGVQVGHYAGQSIPHLHWHLVSSTGSPCQFIFADEAQKLATSASKKRIVFEEEGFTVVTGGFRSGQCFILPKEDTCSINRKSADQFGEVLSELLRRASFRFRNRKGDAPDFQVGIALNGRNIRYAFYLPLLYNWGVGDSFSLVERTPFALPWSHEKAAEYLRNAK